MSLVKLETKVIVIGAGPAGAATSLFLSKHQIPHIVIEKSTFPRDKVCGDACSGKTALVLERANPEWLKEINTAPGTYLPSWGITFGAPNGKTMDIPIRDVVTQQAYNFLAPRLVFDNFLFSKLPSAYCTVFQQADVTGMSYTADGVVAEMTCGDTKYEIKGQVAVAADGDKSIVKRKLLPETPIAKTISVGVRGYYKGVTGIRPGNFLELHFLPEVLPGYLWIFPLADGMANVGVGALSKHIRKRKINLRNQMLSAIANNPQLRERFASAELTSPIAGYGLPLFAGCQSISGNRYLLTGDAAALIDPFSGEGIGNAMYSGMIAANAIEKAVAAGDYSARFLKKVYDEDLYSRIGPELKRSEGIQRLCNHMWLLNFVVNKANSNKTLRDTLSSMFTDPEMQRQLSKPAFYFKLLFNR